LSLHATEAPPATARRDSDPDWWKTAVFYQIYPRSFADSNGDGEGDLNGIRARLDYLRDLGVDALWLSPFYVSPMTDGGYDVADPCDVDPRFGTLGDFDDMVAAAHDRGIKVTVDLVPNHFSDQHVWFQQALAAAPGSRERARFHFLDGLGPDGAEPPNNWPSVFGGPAWTRLPDGQWYLHLFAAEQPDLNWENVEVREEFARVVRFWLERGADGFRVDVAHGMAKPVGLPNMPAAPNDLLTHVKDDPRFDQPAVHDYLRELRVVMDEYPGAMAVGEIWAESVERQVAYIRPDELHLAFNFDLVRADWSAPAFFQAIQDAMDATARVSAPNTWVLANHDIVRHATRFGGGALGQARARAAAMIQLSLPGAAYLYQGDELGLENVDLPDEALQDPTWERSGHTVRGRDGERVPMPWSGSTPPFDFTTGTPWLPMPSDWADVTVEAQLEDSDSTLALYRRMLAIRRERPELTSGTFDWIGAPDGCLAWRRGESFVLVANFSTAPAELPHGVVLLASGPLVDGDLPPDTAVWLTTD
jgi:alpha-glucosidase